jgi:DNA-binding MarR family transcriptional regulator
MLGERVGFLLAKLHHRWAAESVEVLERAGVGLSGLHFGALSIVDGEGPMSQQRLGCLIGKDRTTIVAIVDELERAGLVERRRNPEDRRAYALEVTAAGRSWLAKAKPALVEAEDRLLSDLDEGERAVLMALLGRMLFDERD